MEVLWKALALWGLTQILKEQRALRVSYQSRKGTCWSKPQSVSSEHQLPQGCWIRVLPPHHGASQPLLPGQAACATEESATALTRTQLQCPRAKQAQICVLPAQRDISGVSTSITNVLCRKHDLGCPSCQHSTWVLYWRGQTLSYVEKN